MSIFKPAYALRSILEITPAALKKRGIKALILDVDNTLTTHNCPDPAIGIPAWVGEMKRAGIRLIIVSNNRAERVRPFAETLGVDFVSDGAKPLPFGYIRAVGALGLHRSRICAVGDQIFTDVLGANLAGIRCIFVKPIEAETSLPFRFKRAVEKPLLPRKYNKF